MSNDKKIKDVTSQMDFDNPDDELLPITRCICGKEYGYWEFSISVYQENPYECDECSRKFYFRNSITIYEVLE